MTACYRKTASGKGEGRKGKERKEGKARKEGKKRKRKLKQESENASTTHTCIQMMRMNKKHWNNVFSSIDADDATT